MFNCSVTEIKDNIDGKIMGKWYERVDGIFFNMAQANDTFMANK